ncbi:MAG TPA: DNA translocase FtsK [Desulfitobacteriaceae bacterium]|nr:DNA translocase FtsK [Desulfitobacteriaceae bacterium]
MRSTPGKSELEQQILVNDSDYLEKISRLIELNLEAFGVFAKVRVISVQDTYYEFQMEAAVGTNLKKLEKLTREMASALSAPNGEVKWRIPIPGKNLFGLQIQKPSPKYFEEIEKERQRRLRDNSPRSNFAFILYTIGKAFFNLAYKLIGDPLNEKMH